MATTQKKTTLDDDNSKPSVTQPGDGPHDTTDPLERASTVVPQPSKETIASGVGTVNGQLPLPPIEPAAKVKDPRIEEYDIAAPTGETVHIVRNIETGETRKTTTTDTGSVTTQQAARS